MLEGIARPLLITIAVIVIAPLLIGWFLQLATRTVCKFKPSYPMAYKASLLAVVAGQVLSFVLRHLIVLLGGELGKPTRNLSLILSFFVTAAIYGALIKRPGGKAIGFLRALLVTLLVVLMCIGLIAILVLIAMAVLRLRRF